MADSLGKIIESRFLGNSTADIKAHLTFLWPKVRDEYHLHTMNDIKPWMLKDALGLYKDDRFADEITGEMHRKIHDLFLGKHRYLSLEDLERSQRNHIFKEMMAKFGDKIMELGVDPDSIKISITTDTVLDKLGVDFVIAFDYHGEEICLYGDVTLNKEKTDMSKETYLPVKIIQLHTQSEGGKEYPYLPDVGIQHYANEFYKMAQGRIAEIEKENELRKKAKERIEQRNYIKMR